jgi:GntR family transcriptional regulator / MocR family aminotransferase
VQEQQSVTAPVGHGQHDRASTAHRADVGEGRGVQDRVHGCGVVTGAVRLAPHPGKGRGFIGARRGADASFPRFAWAKAHRQVMARAPDEIFGYGDPAGNPELRRILADYLGRARGVDTDPTRLLICSGFTQALTLICLVLRATGITTLAVEDPGTPRCALIAEAAG